jgi:hypothetical protein
MQRLARSQAPARLVAAIAVASMPGPVSGCGRIWYDSHGEDASVVDAGAAGDAGDAGGADADTGVDSGPMDAGFGDTCVGQSDCAPGTNCIFAGPVPVGQCNASCSSDADCAPDESCVAFGPGGAAGNCSRTCNPITGGGCPGVLRCGLAIGFVVPGDTERVIALCTADGALGAGTPCGGVWECASALACVGQCAPVCDRAGTACPGVCLPFIPPAVLTGVEYGFCG